MLNTKRSLRDVLGWTFNYYLDDEGILHYKEEPITKINNINRFIVEEKVIVIECEDKNIYLENHEYRIVDLDY